MIRKLLNSRGAGKFRRNRSAMLSLFIILAYAALALFVFATNTAHGIGERTGWFDLTERPFIGLLLRERIMEEVGPAEIPGFGLRPSTERVLDTYIEGLTSARRAITAANRIGEESGRTLRDALDENAPRSRPFGDLTLEELVEATEAAEAERDEVLALRTGAARLGILPTKAEDLLARLDQFEALRSDPNADEDDLLIAQEELAFTLEEFAQDAGQYAATAGEGDPIAALNPSELEELALDILDAADPADVELFDAERVRAIAAASEAAIEGVDAVVAERVDAMGPMMDRIFPFPTGAKGIVYRIKLMLGTDVQGRSILLRSLYSSYIAVQVGLVTAFVAVLFGGVFGAAAAYYGGWMDHLFNWTYSMITSIPYLVLLAVLSFLFLGSAVEGTLIPLYVAFGVTYWAGPGRVIRGEALKIRELEYVQAATAIGFGRFYILLKHVLPNTAHLLFINFSLLFIAAIKGEVILTFLGLGLKEGASWGIMIDHSKEQVVNDFFWQIGGATFFMFLLVLAFNIFTDALQDAFDPKHVS